MSDYEVELQEYAGKLHSQVLGINRILQLNTNGLLDSDVEERLLKIKGNAGRLLQKIENNEFEVAIVGLEKAGKSTFANALMGNNILPSKEDRCTYTSTSIRYGADEATVEFFSQEEFDKKFQDNLKMLEIEDAENYTFTSLSLKAYKRKFENLDEKIRQYYGGTVNKDIEDILRYKNNLSKFVGSGPRNFTGSELEDDYFKGFIQDPEYAIAVKEITLRSSKLNKMKNIIVYDVPGFNSPTQMHKEQTISKMKTADAIILVVSAYSPSFTDSVIKIFQNELDEDGIRFGDKMFVFANMADRAEKLSNNMGIIKGDLERHSIMPQDYHSARVIAGSARAKLEKERKVRGNAASTALKEMGIEDGIDLIIKRLEEYNKNERFEVLKQKIGRIESDIKEVKEIFEKKLEEQILTSSDNQKKSNELILRCYETTVKEIKRALGTYGNGLKEKFAREERPLTEKMRKNVIGKINVETYAVTDEEYLEVRNRCLTLHPTPIPKEIENDIRSEKHQTIYDKFSDEIIKVACQEHEECDKAISDIFLNALELDKENPYFEEILLSINKIIENQRSYRDSNGYYKSLVERFSADLFEILLRYSYGDMSRWARFEDDKTNFYSLATYSAEFDFSVTPDKQALHYLILFHSKKQSEFLKTVKKAVENIENATQTPLDPNVVSLVRTVANVEQEKTVDMIDGILSRVKADKEPEDIINTITNHLEDQIEQYQDNDIDINISEVSLSRESYEKYFFGKQDKDKEGIISDINEDINILQSILDDAVIKAICIEKPFLAYEMQIINNVMEALQDGEYREFLIDNIDKIRYAEYSQMREEDERKNAYSRMIDEVKQILDDMKGSSAV